MRITDGIKRTSLSVRNEQIPFGKEVWKGMEEGLTRDSQSDAYSRTRQLEKRVGYLFS